MIDAHHHLWDPDAREYSWLDGGQPWASDEALGRLRRRCTLGELVPLAAGAGVTGSVVVQTMSEEWETRDLLALAAGVDPYAGAAGSEPGVPGSEPGVPGSVLLAGVVGWVDVAGAHVRDSVARLRALPGGQFLCGIRHPLLSEPSSDWLLRPEVLRGLRELGAEGLCFDVVALPHQLDATIAAARSLPEVSFVLDHMAGPPVEEGGRLEIDAWTSVVRRLGALPNVTCKVSGVHGSAVSAGTLRPYYEVVLDAFGVDRMMFGSDWPVSSLVAAYGEVCDLYRALAAELTTDEQDAVFRRTATRVYKLGVAHSSMF